VLSHYILNELARVLPKLAHRHGLNAQEIADLVDILAFQADLVEPGNSMEPRLTDPMDQPVLNTWRAAQADYLLTGDKALRVLGNEYPIITPASSGSCMGKNAGVLGGFSRVLGGRNADKCFNEAAISSTTLLIHTGKNNSAVFVT